MGAEVEGVSRGARVAGAPAPDGFGPWFGRERQVRGIPVATVSSRTRLAPGRIRALEQGAELLGADGRGRAMARALALAIGADPEEAVYRLGDGAGAPRSRPSRASALRLPLGGRALAAVLVAGLGAWLVARLVLSGGASDRIPGVVYRPDYVERLLIDEP